MRLCLWIDGVIMSAALTELCRLCLGTTTVSNLFNSEDVSLAEKVMYCLGIKLQEGDGLPQLICHKCEQRLTEFYDFRQKCRSIDQDLHRRKCFTRGKIKRERESNSSPEDWKLEIKTELDGITLNGFEHLGDWPSDKLIPYTALKHEESLAESLQHTFDCELQTGSKILDKFATDNKERKDWTPASIVNLTANESKKQTSVQCELCGKIFKHKNILKKHLRTHTGVKLFSCKLCKKEFTRAEHEVVHMRAHRGIRPFICEICARAFTKRQDLLRHMLIHSEEKNFACPRCERKFKRSADVSSHMRSHTGHKPYACSSCNKTYSSHSGLKKHRRAHCNKLLDKPTEMSM